MNYKALFDIDENITYLNHASVGLMPKSTTEVMKQAINELARTGDPSISEIIVKF